MLRSTTSAKCPRATPSRATSTRCCTTALIRRITALQRPRCGSILQQLPKMLASHLRRVTQRTESRPITNQAVRSIHVQPPQSRPTGQRYSEASKLMFLGAQPSMVTLPGSPMLMLRASMLTPMPKVFLERPLQPALPASPERPDLPVVLATSLVMPKMERSIRRVDSRARTPTWRCPTSPPTPRWMFQMSTCPT